MSKIFHTGFDVDDYVDILPRNDVELSIDEYKKEDFVINEFAGDIEDTIWRIEEPEIITPDFKKREIKRALDTGAWIIIKGMPVWIPPHYYFFLRFFRAGGERPDFRLNRLMDVYAKIRTRKNPFAKGDLTIKSRQIGETTFEMSGCLHQVAKMDFGLIGMQSATREQVIKSCWRNLLDGWNGMDSWFRDEVFSDFSSGVHTATSMKFSKDARGKEKGKNVELFYTGGTFDSVNNMRRLVLDEWLKWKETSPYKSYLNYEKFMVNGTKRKGLFSIFSSPPDEQTKYAEECYQFWQNSDPTKLNKNGTTVSGIFRHYTSPLSGIEGFFDRYGDADPDPIYDHIISERKRVPKEYRLAEIRAYPLNESEMFESAETGAMEWANKSGIQSRKIYILGTKFKSEITKEPTVVYGNLEWKDGAVDTDVEFRQADTDTFNEFDARFGFAYLPQNKEPLSFAEAISKGVPVGMRPIPPSYVESCLGIDPYQKRYKTGDKNSKGAMVNHKFRDAFDTGIVRCPTMLYIERPTHADIFHEDAIKAALFNRALVQPESITDKIIDYFEDRGYMDWMLTKIGAKSGSMEKGDSPSGINKAEIIGLIDAITNAPNPHGEQKEDYPLMRNWFYELLDSVSQFDPKNTTKSDATMAWGQALLGSIKILGLKKSRTDPALVKHVLEMVLGY